MNKRKRIAVLASAAALAVSACTPQEAIYYTFGQNGKNPQREMEARSVAHCESRMDPGAVSRTNDHGLFQINRPSWYYRFQEVTGQPWEKVYDSFWNAVFAHWLYQNTGHNWSQWTCKP